MTRRPDGRGERGSALVELTWLGLLLLVPLVWVVVSVLEVQRGAFGVAGAARAAARAYALAPDPGTGQARARAAAEQVMADQGAGGAPLSMRVTCSGGTGGCHSSGSVITVRLGTRVDLPFLPDVLGGGSPSFALHGTHAVPYGRFRP